MKTIKLNSLQDLKILKEEEKLLHNLKVIDTSDKLSQMVDDISHCVELAIDLEFDDNNVNIGKTLCVAQIFDGKTAYIIDVIAIKNVEILSQIFNNESITKILHSCSTDLVMLKKYGILVKNIIDTDILNKKITQENQSISLKSLLKRELDVDIDKTEQVSNWIHRPLSISQINYAAGDVFNLIQLKDKLVEKLSSDDIRSEFDSIGDDLYADLAKLLNNICGKTKFKQNEILSRKELRFLIRKKIYEVDYLRIIFKKRILYDYAYDLSIIMTKILNIRKETTIIDQEPLQRSILSSLKKERINIMIQYNSIHNIMPDRQIKRMAYYGFIDFVDDNMRKYFTENKLNVEYVSRKLVDVLKNEVPKNIE